MTRHLRLLGLIAIAMLALLTAPAMVSAQTPVQDQYQPDPDADTDPDEDAGDTDPVDTTDPAGGAVDVAEADADGTLPLTGGSIPTVVLLGLALLAAGLLGVAATRKRRSSDSSGSP